MFTNALLGTAVVAAAALTIVVAAPSSVSAAAASAIDALPTGSYVYDTAFTPQRFGAGSYVGVLKLTVSKDGSISGFYRNADVGMFRPVVGGVSGNSVWLDLGPDDAGQPINAHLEGASIVGGVYADGQPYSFVAKPDSR